MNSIMKLVAIDIRRNRYYLFMFPVIALVTVIEGFWFDGVILFPLIVLVMLATAFFETEHRDGMGFLYLLPVTKSERVCARYLSGLFSICLGTITYFLSIAVIWSVTGKDRFCDCILIFGLGLLLISMEYGLCYFFEKRKKQWINGMIMVLPQIMIVVGFFILYSDLHNKLNGVLVIRKWIQMHQMMLIKGSVVAGVFLWFISMCISLKLYGKRDYV